MHSGQRRFEHSTLLRSLAVIGCLGALALSVICLPVFAKQAIKPAPVKIAVFAFELDDESPAAALLNKTTSTQAAMDKVSNEARAELAQSGKYSVIDASKTDMSTVENGAFKDCDGCEAAIALKLGAEQSLIGVVKRATQTDYYMVIQIRDARSGEVLNQQAANFAGGEEGWATGARMLIRHQILPSED
jgi:hypothetical protein